MKSTFSKTQLAKIEECGAMLMPLSEIVLLLGVPINNDIQQEFYTPDTAADVAYRTGDVRFRVNAAKVMMTAIFASVMNAPSTRGADGDGKRPSPRIDGVSYDHLKAMREANRRRYDSERHAYVMSQKKDK